MRLLRHSPDSGAPRFGADGNPAGRGPEAGRRRCARTDRNRTGHDLLRPGPLRQTTPGRTARSLVPHRRHPLDPAPLRLPHGFPRRGDRSDGPRTQNLQIPRHSLPAYLRRPARGHAPTPYQGPGLRTDRQTEAGHSRPRAAHDPAGRISGRNRSRLRRASGIRAHGTIRTAGRIPLFRRGGDLFGPESAGRCSGGGQTKSCRTSNGASE